MDKKLYIGVGIIVLVVIVWFLSSGGTQPDVVEEPVPVPVTEGTVEGTVMTANTEAFGAILVGANGMTLYTFAKDKSGVSTCYDACATNWPPLVVSGETVAGPGVSGKLGAVERTDGTTQATYNGMPLYYWAKDSKPGDATGHGVNDAWFVAKP